MSAASSVFEVNTDILKAAKFLANSKTAPAPAQQVAESLLAGKLDLRRPDTPQTFDQLTARLKVSRMRHIVRNEPLNSIRWVDLALAHVIVGDLAKAEQALRVALSAYPGQQTCSSRRDSILGAEG
jgi:TolA-binding protein